MNPPETPPETPSPCGLGPDFGSWATDGPIPVTWMRQSERDRVVNVGDSISPLIVAAISGRPVRHANMGEPVERLAAVGTIGHAMHYGHVHLWGSGLDASINPLACGEPYAPPPDTIVEVHAMRGPISAGVLRRLGIDAPAVYGDPAYLLPHIWPMREVPKVYELGVVLHLTELEMKTVVAHPRPEYRRYVVPESLRRSVRLISMYASDNVEAMRAKVALICACKAIVSTSLHGLAFADAYGVPAAWFGYYDHGLTQSDPCDESIRMDHRFRDLFAAMRAPASIYSTPRNEEADWDDAIRAVQDRVAPSGFDAKPLFDAFPLPRAVEFDAGPWPLDTGFLARERL